VQATTAASLTYPLVSRGTNNLGGPIDFQTNGRYRGNGGSQTIATSGLSFASVTTPVVFNFYASASAWIENSNGTNVLSNTTASVFADATGVQYLYLGGRADQFGPLWFAGRLGEVIVYNSNLSTDDRQIVEGYLAWKWGLQANLPSTHPYKNKNPGTP
jgi:hypothetical protein